MEKLANRISLRIASELSFDNDRREVIEYGLIALMQTVLVIAIVIVLGFILGIFTEAVIISLGVSVLRKYSGGAHASSIASCTIISTILCISFAFLGRYLADVKLPDVVIISAAVLTYLFAVVIVLYKVPVDSPNKPVTSESKRRRLKIKTFIVIAVYFVVSAVSFFFRHHQGLPESVFICILISILWQMGTLTGPGKYLVEGSDRLVYRIITLKGGHSNNEN